MSNISLIVRRIPMMFLLGLASAACGAAPEQTGVLAPSPFPSPPALTSTVAPPTVPATPTPPPNTSTSQPTAAPATPPQSTPTSLALLDNAALAGHLYQQVKDGMPVVEIADPQIPLPDDVDSLQVKRYFQNGTISLGLVLQPSMNVMLDPTGAYVASFTGLIISEAGAPWRKYLEIRDAEPTDKNNPYYLWAREGQLYLSIVDQNGAGSGEGYLKLARLSATGDWEIVGCYYFGGTYNGPDADGDYFAYSQHLDKHKSEAAELCQNVEIVVLP